MEFKTPQGHRVMILPGTGISLAEQAGAVGGPPSTWVYTPGAGHLVAGSIDTVAAAVTANLPPAQETASSVELEFMRLARARSELKLAKLQGPAVGRNGRRRTGSGER